MFKNVKTHTRLIRVLTYIWFTPWRLFVLWLLYLSLLGEIWPRTTKRLHFPAAFEAYAVRSQTKPYRRHIRIISWCYWWDNGIRCNYGEIALLFLFTYVHFARRLVLTKAGGKPTIMSSRDFTLSEVRGGWETRAVRGTDVVSTVCPHRLRVFVLRSILHSSWTGDLIWRNISLQCLHFTGCYESVICTLFTSTWERTACSTMSDLGCISPKFYVVTPNDTDIENTYTSVLSKNRDNLTSIFTKEKHKACSVLLFSQF